MQRLPRAFRQVSTCQRRSKSGRLIFGSTLAGALPSATYMDEPHGEVALLEVRREAYAVRGLNAWVRPIRLGKPLELARLGDEPCDGVWGSAVTWRQEGSHCLPHGGRRTFGER
jgi:hypothetical protein